MTRSQTVFKYVLPILITLNIYSFETSNEKCNKVYKDLDHSRKRMNKISQLKKKNESLYQKYKDHISKKIKLTSNILILSTKYDTQKLIFDEQMKYCQKESCLKCKKIKEN